MIPCDGDVLFGESVLFRADLAKDNLVAGYRIDRRIEPSPDDILSRREPFRVARVSVLGIGDDGLLDELDAVVREPDLLVISTMTLTYTGMGVGRLNEIG